jgi:hypothetical protein
MQSFISSRFCHRICHVFAEQFVPHSASLTASNGTVPYHPSHNPSNILSPLRYTYAYSQLFSAEAAFRPSDKLMPVGIPAILAPSNRAATLPAEVPRSRPPEQERRASADPLPQHLLRGTECECRGLISKETKNKMRANAGARQLVRTEAWGHGCNDVCRRLHPAHGSYLVRHIFNAVLQLRGSVPKPQH